MFYRNFPYGKLTFTLSQMQLEALRLAVQVESAPAPVRQVTRNLAPSISAAFVRDTPIFS